MRVRDEIKMTVQAYQTLYESSIAYGMRKALQAEQRKAEMLIKINQLNAVNDDLEQTVLDLKEQIWEALERERLTNEELQRKHEEEKLQLKEAALQRRNEARAKLLNLQFNAQAVAGGN